MSKASMEAHNRIATRIVRELVRDLVEAGADDAAVMLALESVVVGVSRAVEKIFGVSRVVMAEYLEVITERALERLAEQGEGR
ncbi:hypothetical protein [Ancylobacter oerskovii]|uniref:Uncharacterized protein n=1 Tax=Ancylobacter oerskovii TaxID=459519 RepID=A0ABW4YRJ2_9HYPH|nr:hypothetical protein [Ancylobacter oerskovii]MBS7545670.1 hypothetical protein [Ancylobacter oerskovii]